MPFGTLDLSIITDHLIQLLRNCIGASQLWGLEPPAEGQPQGANPGQSFSIQVTGNPPDIVQHSQDAECTIGLYLFHVVPDPYQRNSPVVTGQAQGLPYQPMSLDLYYMLSAWAPGGYVEEQQAMSIAIKCLYESAICRNVVLANDGRPKGEFVLSMEPVLSDEIGRLWQSFTVPNRLTVVYKVSVIFLQPPAPLPAAAPTKVVSLSISRADNMFPNIPQLFGTTHHVRFIGPDDVPADPTKRDFHDYDLTPAVAGPGESLLLVGSGLAAPVQLMLVQTGHPDTDISAWIDPNPVNNSQVQQHLKVPANTPITPGTYQLKANIGTNTTNLTPFSLSAVITPPADPPVIAYGGATITVNGIGLVPGSSEVMLETIALAENAAVGAGQFAISGGGTQLQFRPPTGIASGRYGLFVRVNGIASTPAVWVDIP